MKIQKKRLGGADQGVGSGVSGLGGQGECEQRNGNFVKIKKNWGSGRGGSGWGGGAGLM